MAAEPAGGLRDRFRRPGIQLLYHNAWLVDGDRRTYGKLYNADREQHALELEPVGPWNHSYGLVQIFRSSLRKFDDPWDQSLRHSGPADIVSHDEWYFFLAQAIGKAGFLDQALVEYRQHGSNLVSAKWVRPAVETRLLRRLAHDGSQDLRLARAAEARCSILRQMALRRPEHAPRLGRIADHYQLLAERNRRRFRTYSAPEPSVRLRSLIRSWRQGDYSQWPWGFNKWSVLRDLWSGVALANKATQAPARPERAKHRDGGVEPLAD